MFLFILESLGTSELILIGLVALIVFGPRKLPQMARQAGKFLSDFRKMSSDFRNTWEKEVSFEELTEMKKINNNPRTNGLEKTISKNGLESAETFENSEQKIEIENSEQNLPEIKEITTEDFEKLVEEQNENPQQSETVESEKTNWL